MVDQSSGHDGLFRITTALRAEEYLAFMRITHANKVTTSAYLRAMIIDVIAEESGEAQRTLPE
jgi:hypothetical protein